MKWNGVYNILSYYLMLYNIETRWWAMTAASNRRITQAALLLFSHSVVSDSFRPPWTAACQATLSFTISWSLLKLMSIELMMPYNHFFFCWSLLLPPIFPSIRVFSNESALHISWSKYWSFSISPFNEYWGLISFRIEWFVPGVFSSTTIGKHQFFGVSLLYTPILISVHDYWKNQ